MKSKIFNDTLERVDSLSEHEKESLIEIVQHRLVEQKRNRLAQNIKQARREFKQGKFRNGTVDDFIRETGG